MRKNVTLTASVAPKIKSWLHAWVWQHLVDKQECKHRHNWAIANSSILSLQTIWQHMQLFTRVTFIAMPSGKFRWMYSRKVLAVEPVMCLICTKSHITFRCKSSFTDKKNVLLSSVSLLELMTYEQCGPLSSDSSPFLPVQCQTRSLWQCGNLVVPRTRRRIGDRAFSVAAPRAWNRLPTELKLLRLTDSFCHDLKHFCFILSTVTSIRIDSVMCPRSSSRGAIQVPRLLLLQPHQYIIYHLPPFLSSLPSLIIRLSSFNCARTASVSFADRIFPNDTEWCTTA